MPEFLYRIRTRLLLIVILAMIPSIAITVINASEAKHPTYAFELLTPIAFLSPALDIPYCHHEKWDGSGYPRGLRAEQIPLAARIFAVVDVWDALMSDRPYRNAWEEETVLKYIREQAGLQFDPQVVEVFFEYYRARTLAPMLAQPDI
jgi:HD-GYP domain-containing protein (c-di-GMP phosphodiesterase class II)